LQATQALWHVAAFFIPAVLLGGISAVAARLIWRRNLAGTGIWRLWAWASAAATVASLAGLIASGDDGRMTTYAAMVFASAAALWWSGFRSADRAA
jgi:hypothetical protein